MKTFLVCAGASLVASLVLAEDPGAWPRWRGPQDNGSVPSGGFPVKWTEANILWQAALPGKGCSTPILLENRIYLTAPIDGQDGVLALDANGKPLWQRTLGAESKGKHRNGSGSNPSPATDGRSIFVNFKSGNLAALDPDGTIRWQINLVERYGPDTLYWDHGTSPVLTRQDVVVARMHHGESWLAAFDKQTGELHWKVPRNYETPKEGDNSYTTPIVFDHKGREAILVWGGQHLTAHDAADGSLLWSCGNFNPAGSVFWPAVASPVIAGDVAVVCCGRADRGQPRLHGVRLGGTGDVTQSHRLWDRDDTGSFVPTPAVYKGQAYVLSDRGAIDCVDPATGEFLWSDALPKDSSNYYASPLVADGRLYAVREDGKVFVVGVQDGFQLLAENQLEDRIIASPVPMGDRLLFRGDTSLHCVGPQ
jgi:outer membrane protein assembly factor BamB